MGVIGSILVFVFVLGLVILIHELGHFIFAKRAGILCHEFSLGMGPVLWSKRIGETLYAVRAVPIGGYVMMSGEEVNDEFVQLGQEVRIELDPTGKVKNIILDTENEDYEMFELVTIKSLDLAGVDGGDLHLNEYSVNRDAFYIMNNKELQISPHDRGFNAKTKMQRFLAIFAGPFMNFVLAFFVFILVNLIVGFPQLDQTFLGEIDPNAPAGEFLEEGDKIMRIDQVPVGDWDAVGEELDARPGDRVRVITVIRDGEQLDFAITPVIYFYSIGFHSSPDVTHELVLGEVREDTLAGIAGFEGGDVIVSVGGETVYTWNDVIREVEENAISNNPDPAIENQEKIPLSFVVMRGSEEIDLVIDEPYSQDLIESQGVKVVDSIIGISPEYEFNFGRSILAGFGDIKRSALMIYTTLDLLFNSYEVSPSQLAGPVGIYSITSSALEGGFISLMSWIGLLSVNLGVINLLPIPALDGGRLVFLGYEAITNKKPNKRFENSLHYVMFLLLMGFFVFITYNDILRLFNIG